MSRCFFNFSIINANFLRIQTLSNLCPKEMLPGPFKPTAPRLPACTRKLTKPFAKAKELSIQSFPSESSKQFFGFFQRRLSAQEHLEMLDVATGKPAAKRSKPTRSDYTKADLELGKKSISFTSVHFYIRTFYLIPFLYYSLSYSAICNSHEEAVYQLRKGHSKCFTKF